MSMSAMNDTSNPPKIVTAAAALDSPRRGAVRPYQREALAAIGNVLKRGLRRLLLALPTGTGNPIVFAALIAQRGGRALVLFHCDELLEQAIAVIQIAAPYTALGVVMGNRDDVDAPIAVAGVA
jgi:superfamily II DNA or RNA helicase